MDSTGTYVCGRCKKEITNRVMVTFEGQVEPDRFKGVLNLCADCFSAFANWVKYSEPTKLGPVERVAGREPESTKLGPVEQVARRVDDK